MGIRKNLGTVDRLARVVAGLLLLCLVPLVAADPDRTWAYVGLLGLLPLASGLLGYCPPYALLGLDTRRHESQRHARARPKTGRRGAA